jgi:hypothetical protein
LSKLPFAVDQVQTDERQEFGFGFHWHLLDNGVGHVRSKPRTPRLNGNVGRPHRVDASRHTRRRRLDVAGRFRPPSGEDGDGAAARPPAHATLPRA